MIRTLGFAALALASTSLSGAATAPPQPSEAVLDLLDPTRVARSACGAGARPSTARERQLRLAAIYAESAPAVPMGLSAGIDRSQIPATGLEGEARRYFDQGLLLAYGFNHRAAIASFHEAARLAPGCAMCAWGIALASGPNINAGMDDRQRAEALAALAEADRLASDASPLERALIAAQRARYSAAAGSAQGALDAAYADAMAKIAADNPANDDVAILAIEAAMNTTPWNYWKEDRKSAQPRIEQAVSAVESVLARNPAHVQALHLFIHLMENHADPSRAEAAADRLAKAAPGKLGHLVHMPSHIYYRIGRYTDSMVANVAAARADEDYIARVGDNGLYRYGYYPHNVHFLLASAQMAGAMKTVASETARLARVLDVETARALPWVQAIHAAPSFALAQTGSPDAILSLTGTPSELDYVEAMRRYARAVAYAETRDDTAFAAELAAIDRAATAPGVVKMVDAGFPAPDLVRLASLVARGKQALAAERPMDAVRLFEEAERIEATIPYNEPPFWYYPVAQSRGAALFEAGRYDAARDAFMKALVAAPNNGWAVWGLARAERRLGNRVAALAAERALERTWMGEDDWLRMDRL